MKTLEMVGQFPTGEKTIRTWPVQWRNAERHKDGLRASCESQLKWSPAASTISVYVVEGDAFMGEPQVRTLLASADRPPKFEVGDQVLFQIKRRDCVAKVKTVVGDLGSTLIVEYESGDVRAVSAYECSILGAREISEGGRT